MIKQINPDELNNIIVENIKDENCIFVFSTDVVKNSWIDWIVTHPEESGCSAVPLERFTAWDKFKSQFIKGKEEGKSSIPATLRKFWVQNLIGENSDSPFLKKIINPEFAKEANSFTDWITKMLPGLKKWEELRSQLNEPYDDEDSDFHLLYERYTAFLEKNNMFEPSWIIPDFKSTSQKFIIVFPEILEDFADYIDTLSNNESITLITISQDILNNKNPLCYGFSDSRKELRRILLRIRKQHENGIPYESISLNVPDIQTYRPYLEREFTKYCIPFVIRAGLPLIKNGPGAIFTKIQDCCNSDFSYNSVRALILDEYIPWKEDSEICRENVIKEGSRMRCLCNYTNENGTKIDIWEEALRNVKEDTRELDFYRKLRYRLTKMYNAKSFKEIDTEWGNFKRDFLNDSDFSIQANNIISRCIVHLKEFAQIEEKFCADNNLKIYSPYNFFISELSQKTYTPQTDKVGVNVYPYKLAAAANIKYQYIIDASQANLEVINKSMNFLNNEKRKKLGLIERDKQFNPSKAFITLYAKNICDNDVIFSFAEETFSGFAISHNYLKLVTDHSGNILLNPLKDLDNEDFILNEKKAFLSCNAEEISSYSLAQKNQFQNWWINNKNRIQNTFPATELNQTLKDRIKDVLITQRNKNEKNPDFTKNVITQSDLKEFFQCPRNWLFKNAIKIKEESLDTKLLGPFDMGKLNHKILELFMKEYMSSGEPLPELDENGKISDLQKIYTKLEGYAKNAIDDYKQDFHDSPLVITMFTSQIQNLANNILEFLNEFLSTFGGYYVRGVEKGIRSNPSNLDWSYFGIIDCLLSKEDSSIIPSNFSIIDYKNSSQSIPTAKDCIISESDSDSDSDSDSEAEKLNDFQISMYVTLLSNTEQGIISNAAFYAIKDSKSTFIIKEGEKEYKDFVPSLKVFEKYAEIFDKKIKDLDFSPEKAGILPYETCIQCHHKSICRYSYTVGMKNIKEGN